MKYSPEEKKKLKARILDNIEKDSETGCWLWTGALFPKGYGGITVDGKTERACRVSYEVFKGPLKEGDVVLHKCDEPLCVRPTHLEAGSVAENNKDRAKKGRNADLSGSKNGSSKLTEKQVKKIKKRLEAGDRHKDIADSFKVSKGTIEAIQAGTVWKDA